MDLNTLLTVTMTKMTEFMGAERSTLFLYDPEHDELWSRYAQGQANSAWLISSAYSAPKTALRKPVFTEIRISAHQGVAGAVMQSGETLIIHDAYQDDRFNPEVDAQTGYQTHNLLCVPLLNPDGQRIGVIQVLNKIHGQFCDEDAKLLHALASQAAITLEYAKLLEHVQTLRESEQQLSEALKNQHKQLQAAYHQIEGVNQDLSLAAKKVNITRGGAAAVLLILFALGGVNQWSVGTVLQMVRPAGSVTREDITHNATFLIVEPQPFQSTIVLTGHVEALETVNLLSPIKGVVQKRQFEYGDYVHKDETLLRMDTSREAVLFRDAKVAFIKARNHYQTLENWAQGTEVATARRALTRAELALASLQRRKQESLRLLGMGIIAAEEYDAVEQELANQQLEHQAAQDALDSVLAQGGEDPRSIAKLELENARFAMEEAEAKLAFERINAPVSGVVMLPESGPNQRGVDAGTTVEAGELLVAIGNLEGITVISRVDEVDLRRIRVGQPVLVTGEAFPDLALGGEITNISSRADHEEGKVPFFDITVTVPQLTQAQQRQIRLGMSATLEVVVHDRPDALLLPLHALENLDGEWYAQLKDPATHRVRRAKVETGITNLEAVEILRGLKPGDEVLIPQDEGAL